MKAFLLFASALLAGSMMLSCKKDNNTSNSRKDLIVGKWKYTQFMWDANDNRVMDDAVANVPNSAPYDYDLRPNGQSDGAYTWALTNNDTQLELIADTTVYTYDIQDITSSKLVLGRMLATTPPPGSVMKYGWAIFAKQ